MTTAVQKTRPEALAPELTPRQETSVVLQFLAHPPMGEKIWVVVGMATSPRMDRLFLVRM